MNRREIIISLAIGSLSLMACAQKSKTPDAAPPGYDWSNYEKILLGNDLLEISGMTFAPGQFDSLYAQQDEEGAIFKVGLPSGKYIRTDFGRSGDYEDIAILADTILLLQSDGSFYAFKTGDIQGEKASSTGLYEEILPKGEYEGMFADPLTQRYYVLCKSCKADKKKDQTTVYQLQWSHDSLRMVGSYRIATEKIMAAQGKKKEAFLPSAIARHPITHEFYIVSSINKMLVSLNEQWEITAVYPLSRKLLLQPEGLSFDGDGNMYISSEGDELQAGRILKFIYRKPK